MAEYATSIILHPLAPAHHTVPIFGTCDAEAWAGGRIACVPLECAHVPARSGGDAVIGATACSWSGITAQMLRFLEAGDPVRAITPAS